MLEYQQIKAIVDRIQLAAFGIKFKADVITKYDDSFLIQISATLPDSKDGHLDLQKGAKYYVSQYACRNEILSTVRKAFLNFVEHEAREGFLYKGQAIFGPHWDPDDLASQMAAGRITENTRENNDLRI